MYQYDIASWLQYRLDHRHCQQLLKNGSNSFYSASFLLPKRYRRPIVALYAFCRVADDTIDDGAASDAVLDQMYERLQSAYDGKPHNNPVDRAFCDVVHEFEIPIAWPAALFEGFAWDIAERDYRNLSELYDYSARVAGTVGTMMARIMGVTDQALLSRACDLGVAMQLTNISRDVGEDARNGRLYLPREWMLEQGLEPEAWLAKPEFNDAIGAMVRKLLRAADNLYRRSDWGISCLPASCRPAMFAARTIYADIGRNIARHQFDSVSRRAKVNGLRQARLLAGAVADAVLPQERNDEPPLREVRFLLDALAGG